MAKKEKSEIINSSAETGEGQGNPEISAQGAEIGKEAVGLAEQDSAVDKTSSEREIESETLESLMKRYPLTNFWTSDGVGFIELKYAKEHARKNNLEVIIRK